MKNLYAYNDFLKKIIKVNVVVFYITSIRYKDINIYKKWLVN